ncbi:MAG: multiprotein-bridging factor 1 family protein [Haloarculaceae archaeon]
MAKYSTGGVGGDSGGSCELCGAEGRDLRTATVAGARLEVCPECARHAEDGDTSRGRGGSRDDGSRDGSDRKRRAARNVAKLDDARKGNPKHWEEEGTDYDEDPLPYLVGDYGERLEEARQGAGLQADELAAEMGVDEADILAVEQGRATRAGIGGSLITALEERLNVQLAEEA